MSEPHKVSPPMEEGEIYRKYQMLEGRVQELTAALRPVIEILELNNAWAAAKKLRKLLDASPNQCDGCRAGYPLEGNVHILPNGDVHIGCTKDKYG